MRNKAKRRVKRITHIRKRVSGTLERPRLVVSRSNRQIYAQIIDDERGVTIATVSSLDPSLRDSLAGKNKTEAARMVGVRMAEVAKELSLVIDLVDTANEHLAMAAELSLERRAQSQADRNAEPDRNSPSPGSGEDDSIEKVDIHYSSIGVIHTPYKDNAPYQPVEDDSGVFKISLEGRFAEALHRLEEFDYIYVLYHIHQAMDEPPMIMAPSWAGGVKVGMFASRSPLRPNQIGLSIVKVKRIEGSEIWTSGMDAFDGTPVLDIKPYTPERIIEDLKFPEWYKELYRKVAKITGIERPCL